LRLARAGKICCSGHVVTLRTVPPKSIGPYAIVEELGRGGMGTVYLAERDGQRFAVKLAHEQLAAVPNMVARFLREAQVGRTIDHPNVVRTLDAGDRDGLPYLVAERLHSAWRHRWGARAV